MNLKNLPSKTEQLCDLSSKKFKSAAGITSKNSFNCGKVYKHPQKCKHEGDNSTITYKKVQISFGGHVLHTKNVRKLCPTC